MSFKISRILAAALFALTAMFAQASLAVHPSFDDNPEHTRTNNPHAK